MKYTGLVILLAAMIGTWQLGQMSPATQDMVTEMTQQTEGLIREILQRKRPELKDVIFRQLYAEVVKPGQEMKVHFRLEASEGTDEKGIVDSISEGTMSLVSTDNGQNWQAKTDQFGTPFLRFREPINIKAGEKDTETGESEKKAM